MFHVQKCQILLKINRIKLLKRKNVSLTWLDNVDNWYRQSNAAFKMKALGFPHMCVLHIFNWQANSLATLRGHCISVYGFFLEDSMIFFARLILYPLGTPVLYLSILFY